MWFCLLVSSQRIMLDMHIGQAIKMLRLQQMMTQEQLALEANVATSNISRIENGQRHPSQRLLIRLAESLHSTPANLYAFCDPCFDLNEKMSGSLYTNLSHEGEIKPILTADMIVLLKLFNELSAENKILLVEQAKLLKRLQVKL